MTDANDVDLNAWLAFLQERARSAKARDESADQRTRESFAKLVEPINAVGTAGEDAKSRIIDSPDMESYHAVNHLTKKPDGTTVVNYYFMGDPAESAAFSRSDIHLESVPLDARTRELAREVMNDIVAESGAKIEFREVSSTDRADVTFVKSAGTIQGHDVVADGYAGRAGRRNYIVDGMGASSFRKTMEQVFNEFSPEKREKAKEAILKAYGDKYGKDTDIYTIMTTEREKMLIAHEIEHTLGAQHPDEARGPLGKQTIMSNNPSANSLNNTHEKILGTIDVEWYQRHFGVKHLSDGALPAPSSVKTDKPGKGHEP
jgi:hypothetical protein